MIKNIKKVLYPIGIVVLLLFLLFTTNQLVSFYNNLSSIHPILGIIGTSLLGIIIIGLLIIPFVLMAKLPAPLPFPVNNQELDKYKLMLKDRLAKHPVTIEHRLDPHNPEQFILIKEKLKAKTDQIIFETASAVFVSTAISQNGKLDAFTVLAAQVRLVWKVAHVYWQRPSFRNLQQLYTNVALNTMAASAIEEIDLAQQIQPILNAVLKSPGKHIPVVGGAANIITDSILEGTINSFLTLRVGVMTKNYCAPEMQTIEEIKSNSFVEASGLLKKLVIKSSAKVVEGILRAGKNVGIQTFKSGYGAVEKVVKSAKGGLTGLFARHPKEELKK